MVPASTITREGKGREGKRAQGDYRREPEELLEKQKEKGKKERESSNALPIKKSEKGGERGQEGKRNLVGLPLDASAAATHLPRHALE